MGQMEIILFDPFAFMSPIVTSNSAVYLFFLPVTLSNIKICVYE